MKVFNISSNGLTSFKDNQQRSDNLIINAIKLIVGGGMAITAMIVAGVWAVLIIGGLMLFGLCIKFMEG